MSEKKLALKPQELAEQLGLSMPVIYQLCNRSDFPSLRVGRSWLIPLDPLKAWLSDHADGADVLAQ